MLFVSVCGSGMFIPDPTTATKEEGEKLVVLPFVATNITNFLVVLFLTGKEKN